MSLRAPPTLRRIRLDDVLDRLSAAIARRFEIDLRALAAFRIAIGTLVIADLLRRSRNLTAFYTDSGVLPRRALFSDYSSVYSIHAISGEAWVQGLLFLLAGAFALSLIVGYRTRFATIVSWLLLASLHVRNPMLLNSGDTLLRMLLFWGIFLPLGERWAIDARRSDRDRSTETSIATIAVLLQVVLMYATNAVHKTRSDDWMSGEAVVYILQADQFTILLGNVLAEYHALLEAFTYAWMVLLIASPLLILLTGVPRAVLASAFAGMHLGMLVTLRIDMFALIVVAGLVPFYQSVVWDALASLAARLGVTESLRPRLERLETLAPAASAPSIPAPEVSAPELPAAPNLSDGLDRGRAFCMTAIPYLLLTLVVLSNAEAVDYAEVPDPADQVLDGAQADQNWRMFAPNPTQTTRWYAAPAQLENDTEVDVLHGSKVDLDRPENVEDTYENSRWRKYLSNVQSASNEKHHSYLGNYLCDSWNGQHDTDATTVSIYYMYERSDPYEGTSSSGEIVLQEYDCSGDFVQNDE